MWVFRGKIVLNEPGPLWLTKFLHRHCHNQLSTETRDFRWWSWSLRHDGRVPKYTSQYFWSLGYKGVSKQNFRSMLWRMFRHHEILGWRISVPRNFWEFYWCSGQSALDSAPWGTCSFPDKANAEAACYQRFTRSLEFPDALDLSNIKEESRLLREVKDILDELNMMSIIFSEQDRIYQRGWSWGYGIRIVQENQIKINTMQAQASKTYESVPSSNSPLVQWTANPS